MRVERQKNTVRTTQNKKTSEVCFRSAILPCQLEINPLPNSSARFSERENR
jgi:hypothetical protein